MQNLRLLLLRYTFLAALGLLLAGCEGLNTLLPDAFHEEEFEISVLDGRACEHFSHPLVKIDTFYTEPGVIDTIIKDTMYVDISAKYNTLCAWFDSLVKDSVEASASLITTKFDSLSASLGTLSGDTTLLVSYPTGKAKSYALYTHDISGGEGTGVVFFVDEYVYVDIIDMDSLLAVVSSDMPLETVAKCTHVSEIGEVTPTIKARYVFEPDEASYLVRFTLMEVKLMERAGRGTFSVVVLPSQ